MRRVLGVFAMNEAKGFTSICPTRRQKVICDRLSSDSSVFIGEVQKA